MNTFQPSSHLIEFVKAEEGKRLKAYVCPAGKWTIGYGHTTAAGPPSVSPGMVISQADADNILFRDLVKVGAGVTRLVKVPLTQYQWDALVSFAFNLGLSRLQSSTLLKVLNQGRYADVPGQLMRWVYANDPKTGQKRQLPGLVKRRRAECEIFRGLRWGNTEAVREDPEVLEEQGRMEPEEAPTKPITQSREAIGAAGIGLTSLLGVWSWVVDQYKENGDVIKALWGAMSDVRVILLLGIVFLAGLIIYSRKQRLDEGS